MSKKITRTFDSINGTCTFSITDGKTLVCNVRALVGESAYDAMSSMGRELLGHGTNAKVGDSGASAKLTPAETYDALKSTWENIVAGLWTSKRDGGPRAGSIATVAYANLKSISVEVAVAKLAKMSDEQLKKLGKEKAYQLEKSRETTRRLELDLAA